MSFLKLSPGQKVKVGVTFETPDDQFISMGADEDAKVAIAEGLMTYEVTDELIDKEMGLKATPIVQLTVTHKSPVTEDRTVFMTEDELRRHIYECRAVLKSMNQFSNLVDVEMKEYRKGVRRKSE